MSGICIRLIEIQPNALDDCYDVYITYDDGHRKRIAPYSISTHKAVEYCMSATKKFNSLYISALERALELFDLDVLAEQERKGDDDNQVRNSRR